MQSAHPDAVPREASHDVEALRLRVLGDDITQIPKPHPRFANLHSLVETLKRRLHELLASVTAFAHQKGFVEVPVVAVEVDGNIEVDDIALRN